VIQLNGTVLSVAADPYRPIGIVPLEAGKNDVYGVRCYTVDKEPWWKVSPGSAVKLKGKMPEHGEPDDLFGCVFVETGPNPALTVTAEQLAGEQATNPEAAVTKYNEKWIILEGELLEKNGDKNQLVVKGKGEVKVLCSFGAAAMDKERMNALEVGRKVKVFGQAAVYKTGNVIYLNQCPMTAKARRPGPALPPRRPGCRAG
jgi:hypothetical protein